MSDALDVYFDYVSPFAYLASRLLDDVVRPFERRLAWKPIELLSLSSFEGGLPYTPAKRAYVGVDAVRLAAYHGIPIAMPEPFPVESAPALRCAIVAREAGAFDAFHRAVFEAAWVEQRHVGSEAVLRDCIAAAGGEPDGWLERSRSAEVEQTLRRSTAEAEERGVFGVPTVLVGDEPFWGVDSFPVLAWRLQEQRS